MRADSECPEVHDIDICGSAMNLVTLLDIDSLHALEAQMGTDFHSRAKVAELLIDALSNCKLFSNNSCNRDESGAPLRKSDADFRSALRNASHFSFSQIDAVVNSIDRHNSNRIKFADIMNFFVSAGRRVDTATNRDATSPSTRTVVQYELCDIPTAPHYVTVVPVTSRSIFLAATLRWIDVIDDAGKIVRGSKKIIPPQDPSNTIACVSYFPSLDEVVVGFNNSKIMCFGFLDGIKTRELLLSSPPVTILALDFPLNKTDANSTPCVLTACEDGSLTKVSVTGSSAMRVVHTTKVAPVRIAQLLPFVELGLVAAVSGKALILCDVFSGIPKLSPFIARGVITAAVASAKPCALVFATSLNSNSIQFFSRRQLTSTSKLEFPSEVKLNEEGSAVPASSVIDPICLLGTSPFVNAELLSVTGGGRFCSWNLSQRTANELPSPDPRHSLKLPPSAQNPQFFASLDMKGNALIGNRASLAQLHRTVLEHLATVDQSIDMPLRGTLGQRMLEVSIASYALESRHTAFPNPQHCLLSVFSHGVQVYDVVGKRLVVDLSFGASPMHVNRKGGKSKQPLRIRSACFGPGLTLLVGSESGDIFTYSIEASSLGDCDLIARDATSQQGEVSNIFFSPSLSVVGFSSYDGTLTTAVLNNDASSLSTFITATAVNRCDALDYLAEQNLLAVLDTEEQFIRIFHVVNTGTRLLQIAKLSLFQSMPKTPSLSMASPVLAKSAVGSNNSGMRSCKMRIQKFNNHNSGLFGEHSQAAASVIVSFSTIADSQEESQLLFLVLRDPEADTVEMDHSFLTNVALPQTRNSNEIVLVSSQTIQRKSLTALCSSVETGDWYVGFSDGSVSVADIRGHVAPAPVKKLVSMQLEAVSCLAEMPFVNNIAVCRTAEVPHFLLKQTSTRAGRESTSRAPETVSDAFPPSPIRKARNAASVDATLASRKVMSAKTDRSSSLLPFLPKRSGSAGAGPSPFHPSHGGSNLLDALGRQHPSKMQKNKNVLFLPPLSKKL